LAITISTKATIAVANTIHSVNIESKVQSKPNVFSTTKYEPKTATVIAKKIKVE